MATTLRDVMTTDLVTATTDDTVADAARRMKEGDVGDILIVDEAGKLQGIMTDRDIVVRVIAMDLDPSTARLGDVISNRLHTLTPDDEIDEAVRVMREHAIRRVPIVRDGSPVGIVSIGDAALRKDKDSALAEISAAPPNNG